MSNLQMFDLTGKKAIVTGGTRGLGYGSAEGLMEAGASVVIWGSRDSVFDRAREFAEKGYDCKGFKVDLAERDDRKKVFEESVNELGGLDILVQAAGIQERYPSPDFPLDVWDKVIEINLTSCFDLAQMAIKEFMKNPWEPGQPNRGKIINYGSMASFFGGFTVPAYAAAKGGIAQITKGLCNENSGKGINVNAIAPGYMKTDLNEAFFHDPAYEQRTKNITERIPAGRWGTGDDMKGITVFLASEAADYLSGCVIPVDGGYLVR